MARKETLAFVSLLVISLELLSEVSSRSASQVTSLKGRKVLLISMDGFRYDYLQKAKTPNFDDMIATGVTVPYLNNTFSTMTYPCHTSITTGLYPESHGVVDNVFYVPAYNDTFRYPDSNPKWWNSSEPVWISAVKSGLKVGTFSWPGSAADYSGFRPREYREYYDNTTEKGKVQTMIDWLSRDDFDFVILYFNEPDKTGHDFGPSHPRTIEAIERMDDIVGYMMTLLKKVKLQDRVDIIITSDHGMTDVDLQHKIIDLYDYVNETLLARTVQDPGAGLQLIPQSGKAEELVYALSGIEHMSAFLKEDIPERLHYTHSDRIMPVFVLADEGWSITGTKNKSELSSKKLKGSHGYDNSLMSMKPIFIASGPSFKTGYRLPEPIKSVDIYQLLCHLLKLTPAPNNGSLEAVMPLLQSSSGSAVHVPPLLNLIFVCILLSVI